MATSVGLALLVKEVGTDETGRPNGIAGDEELIRVIGNFPLNRLAAFSGMGITHETVRALVEQASTWTANDRRRKRLGPRGLGVRARGRRGPPAICG